MPLILIVEDEKPLNDILRDNFVQAGFEVITAFNGRQGLEQAFLRRPNIIILDILMPVLDGISVLKKIRTDQAWGKAVPIIILTNVHDSEQISDSMNYNIDKYWIKSDTRISELVKLVKERLEVIQNSKKN